MKKVVVVGLGYVGLPLALLLAKRNKVMAVDTDQQLVAMLKRGETFITEKEVRDELNSDAVHENLQFKVTPEAADVFVICVPTPLGADKVADLKHVRAATQSIAPHLKSGNLVILESTVPPQTCRTVLKPILEKAVGLRVPEDVLLAHCPERVLPGNSIYELVHNCRIIGGLNFAAAEAAENVYCSFVKGEIILTDDVTAELCKIVENAYRDVNIAFANEISLVAANLDVDPNELISLANKHPRVSIAKPGIGVGGHCIPVDPWFIKQANEEHSTLIEASRKINDDMPSVIASKIRNSVAEVKHPKIVAIGMAYKPNTADTRESPSMEVVRLLREDHYDVTNHDPMMSGNGYDSLVEAVSGADCLAVLVEHDVVIKELESNLSHIKASMRTPVVLRF